MSEPEQRIIDKWNEMCAIAQRSIDAGQTCLEYETLTGMHSYFKLLQSDLERYNNPKNWTRSFNDAGVLINEHALYRPKLKDT